VAIASGKLTGANLKSADAIGKVSPRADGTITEQSYLDRCRRSIASQRCASATLAPLVFSAA
jgi:hypothetical protein